MSSRPQSNKKTGLYKTAPSTFCTRIMMALTLHIIRPLINEKYVRLKVVPHILGPCPVLVRTVVRQELEILSVRTYIVYELVYTRPCLDHETDVCERVHIDASFIWTRSHSPVSGLWHGRVWTSSYKSPAAFRAQPAHLWVDQPF